MKTIAPQLAVTIALSLSAMAQTFDQAVARLARAETIDGPMVGYSGEKSESYRVYEALRREATGEQLRGLLQHDSRVVRGYAARACFDNGVRCDWVHIVGAHIADTTQVTTFEGCCLAKRNFGDYLFDLIRSKNVLSAEQLLDLGDRLVREKSPLYAREWALRTLRFRDEMLHTVRGLAAKGDHPAVIALARYGVAKDVPLLIAHLKQPEPFDGNCWFLAAEISRDARLLPALIGLDASARERMTRDNPSRLRFWLKAIAVHKNRQAADYLTGFAAQSIAGDYKRKNLRQTMREVLKPFGEVEVFAALLASLKD